VNVVALEFANLPLQEAQAEFPLGLQKIMSSMFIFTIPLWVVLLLWLVGIVEINLF
jgi:hypothetical protein